MKVWIGLAALSFVVLTGCRPEPDMVTSYGTEIFCQTDCPPIEQFDAAELSYVNGARHYKRAKALWEGYGDLQIEVWDNALYFQGDGVSGLYFDDGPKIKIFYHPIAKYWNGLWLTAFCHELGHMYDVYVTSWREEQGHASYTFMPEGEADRCQQFLIDNFAPEES